MIMSLVKTPEVPHADDYEPHVVCPIDELLDKTAARRAVVAYIGWINGTWLGRHGDMVAACHPRPVCTGICTSGMVRRSQRRRGDRRGRCPVRPVPGCVHLIPRGPDHRRSSKLGVRRRGTVSSPEPAGPSLPLGGLTAQSVTGGHPNG